MRIAVINPTTTEAFAPLLAQSARAVAAAGTEIEILPVRFGPASIEGHLEEEVAAIGIIDAIAASGGDVDGFVIACYGDPGLYAAREVADAPVVGIGEASLLTASLVAHRFSIVTILRRFAPAVHDMVRRYGLEARVASVRATDVAVLDAERDPELARQAIAAEACRAVAEDGAEAICLGCGGFSGLAASVEEAAGVPVVDGVPAAVKLLEALAACGLRTSRAGAFKAPEVKALTLPGELLAGAASRLGR